MERFEDRTVVITGGNKGIGYALAERFVSEGARVVIASVDADVKEAAARLGGSDRARGVHCDVTDKSQVEALYTLACDAFGKVDISVQNAGIITIARVEDLTEAEWDATLAVNTKGVFLCCQEAVRRMRAQGSGGRLINTASGQARDGFIYTPHYAASKFGVMGLIPTCADTDSRRGFPLQPISDSVSKTTWRQAWDALWRYGGTSRRRSSGGWPGRARMQTRRGDCWRWR
jgi:meso-butanediol dehydrogenase/(S,S)-butanediol dehydrogenase/diacetyl reductase